MIDGIKIESLDGCIYVHGGITPTVLAGLVKMAPKGAVIDADLARMAGADMVIAAPDVARRVRAQLAADIERKLEAAPVPGRDPALMRWLATGARGSSSNALVAFLADMPNEVDAFDRKAHPLDPDDLNRCRKLLEQVPSLQTPFRERAGKISAVWGLLVPAWDELCSMMDAEAPEWREGRGSAPKTFKRMDELIVAAGARMKGSL